MIPSYLCSLGGKALTMQQRSLERSPSSNSYQDLMKKQLFAEEQLVAPQLLFWRERATH